MIVNSDIKNLKYRTFTMEDLRFDSPCLPVGMLHDFAAERFRVAGKFEPLQGERDQNFRITTHEGQQYVLKVSGQHEDSDVVDYQVKALLHIEQKDAGIPVPRLIPAIDGNVVQILNTCAQHHRVRLLTFLPGITYDEGPAPSLEGLHDVGVFLARHASALEGFEHPAARQFMPWDICNGLIFNSQLQALLSEPVSELIRPALHRLEYDVYPRLAGLRRQVIHHDGHGGNLLRQSASTETVTGVIDFGDMIEAPLICELAVSLASFVLAGDNLEAIVCALCRGFDSVTPLTAGETDLLPDLIIARLILTLQLFEFRRTHADSVPDFVIEEQPAMIAALQQLISRDSSVFNQALRDACRPNRQFTDAAGSE